MSLKVVANETAVIERSPGLSFARELRLLSADEYQTVFKKAKRFGNRCFTLLARKNDVGHPRLGLAISKKCARKAVDRNRIKRNFRESFRLHQHQLPSVDIIAMCKPCAIHLDQTEMRQQIDLQWLYIKKRMT